MRFNSISQYEIYYNSRIGVMNMRLRDLREDRDLTQQEIASHLNIRQNTYSQYENGVRQIPIDCLIKIALYFDTSVDYVIGLTDTIAPYPRSARIKAQD